MRFSLMSCYGSEIPNHSNIPLLRCLLNKEDVSESSAETWWSYCMYVYTYWTGEFSLYKHSWELDWNYRIGRCDCGLDCLSVFPKYFSKISKNCYETLKNLFFVEFSRWTKKQTDRQTDIWVRHCGLPYLVISLRNRVMVCLFRN